MSGREAKRLRELEKDNLRLKRLLAERDLEVDVLKECLQKNDLRRRTPSGCTLDDPAEAFPATSLRSGGCESALAGLPEAGGVPSRPGGKLRELSLRA